MIGTRLTRRRLSARVRRAATVIVAGVTLYVVLPATVHVVAAWPRLASLQLWWLAVAIASQVVSFTCTLALLRVVLHRPSWFAVVTAGLAGNAVTNTLPGGDAVGAGVQYRMLSRAGVRPAEAAGGLAASAIIGVAGLFILPVFALPAIVGGSVNSGLEHAAILGLVGFVLIVALSVVLLVSDRALAILARALQWLVHLVRRRVPRGDLVARSLAQRDELRADLGRSWWRAVLLIGGRIGFDYGSLLAALRATGDRANPSLVLLAYAATAVVALVPLTPGGIGIVEASLSGLLVLAGVPAARAVLATLAYRVGSYWLPIGAGGVAYASFRRRYGSVGEETTSDGAAPST